jgi:hypothetical protein
MKRFGLVLFMVGAIVLSSSSLFAAESISLIAGSFVRSIPVSELEYFAETGKPIGLTKNLLDLAKQDYAEAHELLQMELEWDLVEADELLRSEFGDTILDKLSLAVAPRRSNKYGKQALRAAIILSLADDGMLTPVEVIKTYPTDIRINIGEALKIFKEMQEEFGLSL